MKFKILVSACAVFAIFAAQANAKESVNTAPVKLEAVEVNSVGDNISNSGIDEGFLSKNVQNGILAGKRALDVPYQINTITKETMGNQGVNGFEDVIKYFPSASITMFGGSVAGRPQTRGFGANVVGNVFWDGFYAVATTATPMAMFESLQVQNGLAGSLYGAQNPVGIFSYTKKRPVDNEHTIWGDYVSRKNFGLGLDSSMKFENSATARCFTVAMAHVTDTEICSAVWLRAYLSFTRPTRLLSRLPQATTSTVRTALRGYFISP